MFFHYFKSGESLLYVKIPEHQQLKKILKPQSCHGQDHIYRSNRYNHAMAKIQHIQIFPLNLMVGVDITQNCWPILACVYALCCCDVIGLEN